MAQQLQVCVCVCALLASEPLKALCVQRAGSPPRQLRSLGTSEEKLLLYLFMILYAQKNLFQASSRNALPGWITCIMLWYHHHYFLQIFSCISQLHSTGWTGWVKFL